MIYFLYRGKIYKSRKDLKEDNDFGTSVYNAKLKANEIIKIKDQSLLISSSRQTYGISEENTI